MPVHIIEANKLRYPISRKIAREQGYLQKMLSFQSYNPETREWFEYMRQHVWEGI